MVFGEKRKRETAALPAGAHRKCNLVLNFSHMAIRGNTRGGGESGSETWPRGPPTPRSNREHLTRLVQCLDGPVTLAGCQCERALIRAGCEATFSCATPGKIDPGTKPEGGDNKKKSRKTNASIRIRGRLLAEVSLPPYTALTRTRDETRRAPSPVTFLPSHTHAMRLDTESTVVAIDCLPACLTKSKLRWSETLRFAFTVHGPYAKLGFAVFFVDMWPLPPPFDQAKRRNPMQDRCCELLAVPSTWRRGIANFRFEARDSVCRGSETVSHPAPRKQSRAAEPQRRGEERRQVHGHVFEKFAPCIFWASLNSKGHGLESELFRVEGRARRGGDSMIQPQPPSPTC